MSSDVATPDEQKTCYKQDRARQVEGCVEGWEIVERDQKQLSRRLAQAATRPVLVRAMSGLGFAPTSWF